MKKIFLFISYAATCAVFVIFSYGFVDKNLILSQNPTYSIIQSGLSDIAYNNRPVAAAIFFVLLIVLFLLYWWTYILVKQHKLAKREVILLIAITYGILVFAYSLVSYDIFNYIATAKMLFTHHENPYIVMPVEIPNDPNLAFTRAANKLALYGPTWIVLTAVPHFLGFGNIWATMIAFKMFAVLWLIAALYLIKRMTGRWTVVVALGLNPLILIETVISGHNDIVMMVLALAGLALVQIATAKYRITGWVLLVLSVFVKGATAVLAIPLLFRKKGIKLYRLSFWLLFAVFFFLTPIREELYPWYAVWFFIIAAMMPFDEARFEWGITIAFSIGLELRALPYMYMGYYGGPGPMLRTVLTMLPVFFYLLWIAVKSKTLPWYTKKK